MGHDALARSEADSNVLTAIEALEERLDHDWGLVELAIAPSGAGEDGGRVDSGVRGTGLRLEA